MGFGFLVMRFFFLRDFLSFPDTVTLMDIQRSSRSARGITCQRDTNDDIEVRLTLPSLFITKALDAPLHS